MMLTPLDSELSWTEVEACFSQVPAMAEQIWAAAGIIMPDEAADDLQITMIEELLNKTSAALNIPLHEIYSMRKRIRWLKFSDTPAAELPIFASLDGGQPIRINPTQTTETK